MSVEGELREIASKVAARVQKRAASLQKEYLDAQKLALEKKAQFDFANGAFDRATSFEVTIGTDYQCPTCWIENGIRSKFRPLPSKNRDDVFECQYGHDLIVTY